MSNCVPSQIEKLKCYRFLFPASPFLRVISQFSIPEINPTPHAVPQSSKNGQEVYKIPQINQDIFPEYQTGTKVILHAVKLDLFQKKI